jgi:hypothetical protein
MKTIVDFRPRPRPYTGEVLRGEFVHDGIALPRRKVLRINRADGVRSIQVRQGVVWITGSPGREDVLVRRGEVYRLPAQWPFVLEALSDARVELLA